MDPQTAELICGLGALVTWKDMSGLVRCGVCGGGFVVWTSGANTKQRARGNFASQRRFTCGRRLSSGWDVCSNTTTVEIGLLERRVMDAIESRVLTPEGLDQLHRLRRDHLREGFHRLTANAPAIEKEWVDAAAAEARLIEAIKSGVRLDSTR